MNVSTDMRRDESLDALKRPGPYAYAPGAGGFFTILTQIRELPESQSPDRAPEPSSKDAAPAADKPESTSAEAPSDTGASQDTDAASETATSTTDTNETPDPAETPEALQDPTPSENAESGESLADGDTPLPEGAEAAPVETGAPIAEAAAPVGAMDTSEAHPALDANEATNTAPPLQAEAPTNTPAAPLRAPVTPLETTTAPALAADVEVEVDPAPADAPPPLPKSLNALLAESVLREMAPRDAAAPNLEPEIPLDIPRETGPTPPAEETPLPAPTPRAGAMDLAGLRTEATAPPRIPLANLPGELAQQVHLMQQEGARSMRLRIVPEHLGELRIEIQGAGDTLRVRMIAASATVRDALDSQMADLRQAFQKQGLNLNNVTVDAGAGGRESPFRQETASRFATSNPDQQPAPESRPRPEIPAVSPSAGATALNILA